MSVLTQSRWLSETARARSADRLRLLAAKAPPAALNSWQTAGGQNGAENDTRSRGAFLAEDGKLWVQPVKSVKVKIE